MTKDEAVQALSEIKATQDQTKTIVGKIKAETAASLQKITDLESQIGTREDVPADIAAAITDLKGGQQSILDAANEVDGLVPDATTGDSGTPAPEETPA